MNAENENETLWFISVIRLVIIKLRLLRRVYMYNLYCLLNETSRSIHAW